MSMLSGKSVLVTGANRGIGKALVEEALDRGAARVYAASRRPLDHPDTRVVPLTLDVTDEAQIRAAADAVTSLDLLVNNAGVALRDDDLSDRALLERHFAVNVFGIFDLTRVMLTALTESRGTVLNILSTAAWVSLPPLPGYSALGACAGAGRTPSADPAVAMTGAASLLAALPRLGPHTPPWPLTSSTPSAVGRPGPARSNR
jgi:NAD(P)-dependent dehydrogenase (short-subunit alcohol dehydrogenase family)